MFETIKAIVKLVRPFIAVSATVGTLWLTFTGKLAPEVIGTAFASVSGFYFGERAALKRPGQDNKVND